MWWSTGFGLRGSGCSCSRVGRSRASGEEWTSVAVFDKDSLDEEAAFSASLKDLWKTRPAAPSPMPW